ncbi:MAG TPA: glycosyltransferase family 2 protein [Usitatibacter sp.]|jgi:glycosyltransferase involved in cell wall biosynthesis|nr:glycosyltransferase family 2 protein [Usitatibacter sp.]
MSVCLNMIVRDESAVIERCLTSVRPHIDQWVIVDTGSVDDTRERIRRAMQGVPGELFERPWRDFGHNRTEALALARARADYLLFIDADETLACEPRAAWPQLVQPAYSIEARYGELRYDRVSLVSTRLPWRWEGVLHEYLEAGRPVAQPRVPGFWIEVGNEGARSRDPRKFEKDAAVLEAAVACEPSNARYVFYLAQSWRDAGQPAKARERYAKRAAMGGWDEEVWYSLYQLALLSEQLQDAHERVLAAYLRAHEARPKRAETLVALARYLRLRNERHGAYLFAQAAKRLAMSTDRLFVDATAYGWRRDDELALAAFYSGRKDEAAVLWRAMLAAPDLPVSERARVERNLSFT